VDEGNTGYTTDSTSQNQGDDSGSSTTPSATTPSSTTPNTTPSTSTPSEGNLNENNAPTEQSAEIQMYNQQAGDEE